MPSQVNSPFACHNLTMACVHIAVNAAACTAIRRRFMVMIPRPRGCCGRTKGCEADVLVVSLRSVSRKNLGHDKGKDDRCLMKDGGWRVLGDGTDARKPLYAMGLIPNRWCVTRHAPFSMLAP